MSQLPVKIHSSVRAKLSGRTRTAEEVHERGEEAPSTEATLSRLEDLPLKMLRFPSVRERTGLSRTTIWRLERQGAFPRHRRISANAVAWLEHEVSAWIREKSTDAAS